MGDDNKLEFRCPKTGTVIDTGIYTTAKGLADNWDETLHIRCAGCGGEHVMKVRDLYTAYMLSSSARREA